MGWTSKIYPDRFVPFSLYSIAEERCVFFAESRGIHTSTRTNIKNRMKKIIPTMFATVLAISSVSLLVGCGGIEDDPDAQGQNIGDQGEPLTPEEKKQDEEQKLTPEEQKKLDAEINPPEPEEKK